MFYLAIIVLLLSPFLLSINLSYFSSFAVMISVMLLFIENRFNKQIRVTNVNIMFSLFVFSLLLFLPFSFLASRSIVTVVWFIGYIGIFIYSQNLVTEKSRLENISKIFVILSTVFGIFSITKFIEIGLTSYTRLDGIIGPHNVYGGFLVLPLLLSIYFIFEKGKNWQRYVWMFASAVLLTSMVLTFSRGTWLSIVLAVVFSIVVFWSRIKENFVKLDLKRVYKKVGILLILSFAIFCGIWAMARETTLARDASKPIDTVLFPQQTIGENAFIARLHYFEDAWKTFIHAPIIGFGSGLYANAVRMYKTDPSYGSFADPHNWFLKMLVENGIIVTTIFLAFIISLFYSMAKMIRRRKEFSWLVITIFTALVGSVVHGLMDFDWSNYLFLLVFFVFVSSLYGYLLYNDEPKSKSTEYFPKWVNYAFLALIIVVSIVSIQILRADLVRARGDVQYFNFKDSDGAIDSYFESVTLNSHEPLTWYNLWRVYFANGKYVPAKNCILKAIEMFPENGIYWGALARTQEQLGEDTSYRDSLLKAIKYFPASDLSYYVKLVEYDFEQKKYDEAMSYINQVLPLYTKYQKSLWYSNDPNSPVMSQNLTILKEYKEKIDKSRND